ncbi:MAG TPA: alpha/beta fold hydrolase [Kiritimatiellia bacterium]|nr:alpha/beta fold hydrolase [Kiritimatiellia bacterium]
MKAYLFTGWAFPDAALRPLTNALGFSIASTHEEADIWIGWSLGGLHALAQTDAKTPLVLISSTARFCGNGANWPGLPPANLRALQRQVSRTPEEAMRGFHRLCASDAASDDEIESRVQESLRLELSTGLRDLAALDLRAQLPSIHTPVLLVHGARDRVIPVEAARATAALLPNATLHEHPTAGHDLPLTEVDWIAKRIADFLDSPS